MASHISARSPASRNKASSPPRSSIARRTRAQSATVELGNAESNAKRIKRSTRHSSNESSGSNASADSRIGDHRRKGGKRGEVAYPDLPAVTEDAGDEDEEEEEEEDEEEQGEEGARKAERSARLQQSPGGLSQMSGTTAITSVSVQTSHTTEEVEGLDPTLIIEVLPDLWVSSLKILTLLAPANASDDLVESAVRDLKVPGSARAKRLMHREQKFSVDKAIFGSDNYIRVSFILQKVFKSPIEPGMPRPDAILQAANLATLVKGLLVSPRESASTFHFFSDLDTWFPESFVTQFADNTHSGNSTLLDESFEMALDIRTQYAIVALLYFKSDEQEWHPEHVLTDLFHDPLDRRTIQASRYGDAKQHGKIKKLMRKGPKNTPDQEAMIMDRISALRETFRQSEDAAEAGDLVDFDELEKQFPWAPFLVKIVHWARSRLDEIEESVRQQGGVDNLVKSLVEAIKNNDSQVELDFEPHPSLTTPRKSLPSTNTVPITTGHSIMDEATVLKLELLKRSSEASTSHRGPRPATLEDSKPRRRDRSRMRSAEHPEYFEEYRQATDGLNPVIDDNDEEMLEEQYVSALEAHERGQENVDPQGALNGGKFIPGKRFIDKQANARKAQWLSQESEGPQVNAASAFKPKDTSVEPSEGSASQDEGFEADRRNPDPERRIALVGARAGRPTNAAGAHQSKRRRVPENEGHDRDDGRPAQSAHSGGRRKELPQASLRADARRAGREVELEEDDDELVPRPSATQIANTARMEAAFARRMTAVTQTRKKWSEADSTQLIDLIGKLGCSWSLIQKVGNFEVERGQVALKDRARTLKVQYEKSDMPLPPQFDKIALGLKEIKAIRAVRPDYDP